MFDGVWSLLARKDIWDGSFFWRWDHPAVVSRRTGASACTGITIPPGREH